MLGGSRFPLFPFHLWLFLVCAFVLGFLLLLLFHGLLGWRSCPIFLLLGRLLVLGLLSRIFLGSFFCVFYNSIWTKLLRILLLRGLLGLRSIFLLFVWDFLCNSLDWKLRSIILLRLFRILFRRKLGLLEILLDIRLFLLILEKCMILLGLLKT